MDLKQFLTLLKNWFWVVILGLVLGIAGGIASTWIITPVYQAQTKILVLRAPQDSTSPIAYLSDTQLTQTFGQFLVTKTVLDAVSNELNFKVHDTQIQFAQVGSTQIIQLTVQDSDPERAALIANTVVRIAIQQYGEVLIKQYTASEANFVAEIGSVETEMSTVQAKITLESDAIINTQTAQIQTQIDNLTSEISRLQKEINGLTPAYTLDMKNQVADKQAQLDADKTLLSAYTQVYINLVVQKLPLATGSVEEYNLSLLQDTLTQYKSYYISLNSSLANVRQRKLQSVSNVAQIDTAAVPKTPVRPQLLVNTMLAGAGGLALAFVAIFIIDSLVDKSPKKPREEDVESPSERRKKELRALESLEENEAPGETLKEDIKPLIKPQKSELRVLESLEENKAPSEPQIEDDKAPVETLKEDIKPRSKPKKRERRVLESLEENKAPSEPQIEDNKAPSEPKIEDNKAPGEQRKRERRVLKNPSDNNALSERRQRERRVLRNLEETKARGEPQIEDIKTPSEPQIEVNKAPSEPQIEDNKVPSEPQKADNKSPTERRKGERRVLNSPGDKIPSERRKGERRAKAREEKV
jgi:capsular polysaccharide biosynthesis protein